MFVYVIVNSVTLKIYVGKHQGNNLRKYLQDKFAAAKRKTSGNSHLFNAMRKYTDHSVWSIHPLISDCTTNEELSHWEQVLIKVLATQNPEVGYNICRGGEGFTGRHSLETRQTIADASREMWKRPEIRENFTAKRTGHAVSAKTVDAVRRMRLGTKATPETVEKLRNSHIGLTRSAESRKKQSRSVTGTGNHFFGKKHSEATRKVLSVCTVDTKPVRCIDTGEVFPSLRHAVERLGGNKSNLARSIRKEHKFLGRRFAYVNQ